MLARFDETKPLIEVLLDEAMEAVDTFLAGGNILFL